MSSPAFAPGVYAIINSRGNHALDTNGTQQGNTVVADSYIGSTSQQWNISTQDGVGYHIQNVSSGRYLGLPANFHAQNNHKLQEVTHMFPWHLNRRTSQDDIAICVPYSKFVIDLDPAQVISVGSHILSTYIFEQNQQPRQGWLICKDLHLKTPLALENGCTYKIVNAQGRRTITFTNDTSACAVSAKNARAYPKASQEFQAIGTGQAWAFKNVSNGRYLGIPLSTHQPKFGRVTSVVTQLPWMVLPDCRHNTSYFKIWAPFVEKVVGEAASYDGTLFLTEDNSGNIFWTFEKVSGPVAERSGNPGTVTGERDRE